MNPPPRSAAIKPSSASRAARHNEASEMPALSAKRVNALVLKVRTHSHQDTPNTTLLNKYNTLCYRQTLPSVRFSCSRNVRSRFPDRILRIPRAFTHCAVTLGRAEVRLPLHRQPMVLRSLEDQKPTKEATADFQQPWLLMCPWYSISNESL